ncbi:bacterial mobilization protein MobC [Necator americanus]|uniref:Bacterial mobilization protein MobC n=1 Tax=Necator americanus TaxID=51031 RepID=W2THD5_NECAM|nr:bacterial mobilization protein MobC [Necator americanus]ETN81014.1 bacterial mobilization protein MobC [Necator americanus]
MAQKPLSPVVVMGQPKATRTTDAPNATDTTRSRKGGRPKKADNEKRSKAIQVRLKPAGYQYVQQLAEQRNTSMADVIRELCNGDVTVITPEQENLLRQIATMANNLNQLARKANTDGIRSVALLVQRRAQELGELLDRYAK